MVARHEDLRRFHPDVRCTEFGPGRLPVYLKTGSSTLTGHSTRATQEQTEDMLQQMEISAEFMARHYPEARQSPAKDSSSE
ncbi:hypothetical protein AB0B07_16885 [Streptomyces sioyaensis]|uniref:hypothetical protein n=1 Tax=Streptomyces sioyaensis TaxID=67364 RepID=UPI0034053675